MKLKKLDFTLPFVFLFFALSLHLTGQNTPINVTFDNDNIGELPLTAPGNGMYPTELYGDFANGLSVQAVSGDISSTTASGNVLEVNTSISGNFNLVEFEALLNAGIIDSGVITISFDFIAFENNTDGFAFLRNVDDNEESMADIGFNFDGTSYNVGLLDYDSTTGEYLGWLAGSPPANSFETGRWYHLEQILNLDTNTHTLKVDGVDYGVSAGISRATGTGFSGSFYNWGTSFVGRSAIDNFRLDINDDDGLPSAPQALLNLLDPELHGGTAIRILNGDFRESGIDWETNGSALLYKNSIYNNMTTYSILVNEDMNEADARLFSYNSFEYIPNRTYEVSALIRTNFPRDTWEINIGPTGSEVLTTDGEALSDGSRYGGMPAITEGPEGWERWTWRFTPHWDNRYPFINVFIGLHEYGPGFDGEITVDIADIAFVELPEVTPEIPAPGDGVTLPGGNGALEMEVEEITSSTTNIIVELTGATIEFDITENQVKLFQKIDFERELAVLSELPLSGLTVSSETENEVVLIGNNITIGVQMDGVVMVRSEQTLNPIITNKIGGDFNRMYAGDLLSQDDFGGFTINQYAPKGSGRTPELIALNSDLSFLNFTPTDLTSTGETDPDWQATTSVVPGELLIASVFPSRPYDWEKSFEHFWDINDYGGSLEYDNPEYVDNWVLWNFSERGWAMSFGERYELRDNIPFQDHFNAVAAAGDIWSTYFSQWFYYSRDAEEWVNEALRWRDEYGMGAIYSDGLAQDDFMSAYEAMRRLRGDVFPNGDILIHDSFPQSGVAAAAFRPFIYSYATSTYMGESAEVDVSADWAWARYAMSQYRRSNAFGVIKGDGWTGFEGVEKYLVSLVWGGRGRPDVTGFESEYIPKLNALKELWETYGDDPYFFDRYYHPEAQILTGYNIGRAGMPYFSIDDSDLDNQLLVIESWTPDHEIYYTTDGTETTENGILYDAPIPYTDNLEIRARAYRDDLEDSREAFLGNETLSVTSFNETSFKIYPNPTSENVDIEVSNVFTDYSVQLVDITGKIILETERITNRTTTVNCSSFSSGLYLVVVKNFNGQEAKHKLIIE